MIRDDVLSTAMDLWYIIVARPNDPNDPDHLDHSPHRQHTKYLE